MPLSGLIILIADKNPNIRSLIMRELRSDGYHVRNAGTVSEILYHVSGLSGHPILLILDPDLPDAGHASLEKVLNERIPQIPIIIHALKPDHLNQNRFIHAREIIEKDDKSIEILKKAVEKMLDLFPGTHFIDEVIKEDVNMHNLTSGQKGKF